MRNVADIYDEIGHAKDPRKELVKHAFGGLSDHQISDIQTRDDQSFYRGKVRDLIFSENEIKIIHSDRLTAFDRFIDLVPYKGVILNHISTNWLERAKHVTSTHLIKQFDDRTLLVTKTDPIRIEVVVRGYLAGSLARAYAKGARDFCGIKLPENLKINQKLPEPIITPTTKAPVGDHDEAITQAEIIQRGLCTQKEWDRIEELSLNLFQLGTDVSAECGWILVDTKYEFGRNAQGEVILIDEIHTPDSSRFWLYSPDPTLKDPVMLDKEVVRRWLLDHGFDGHGQPPTVPVDKLLELARVYLQVAETVIGRPIQVS